MGKRNIIKKINHMQIEHNGVQITLTSEQLAHIECETKKTKYTDYTSIKTFEDACEKLGYGRNDFELFKLVQLSLLRNNEIAFIKLNVIIRALNDGWNPNWNDVSEKKWKNWFGMKAGFSCYGTGYYYTATHVPSALCFKTREIAEYAAKQFLDLYKQLYS